MKKILLTVSLCLVLMLALVACDGCASCDGSDTTTAPGTTPPEPSPVEGFIALTEEGKSLYRMVLPIDWISSMVNDTATVLKNRIYSETGATSIVAFDNTPAAEREILIGATSRNASVAELETLAPRDWRIKVLDGQIIIAGGSMYSTCLALDNFSASLVLYEGELYLDPDYSAEYIYERDNTEDVYGTLDEKHAQFADPNGRLMVTSHRAEHLNNPENSRAAIAAAVALGADILELDVRRTKDGHYVLCHDDTLTRTTNVADFAGKNGYPSSHNVSEWTLEQLKHLTLTGSAFNETIVTVEEAFLLVRGRAFFDFDKTTSKEDRLAVYRIAVRLRAVDSLMYQGGSLSHDVMQTIYKETGIAVPYLYNAGSFANALNYINNTFKDLEYAKQAIQITTSVPDPSVVSVVAPRCRLWMNTLGWSNDPTGPQVHADNENSWKKLFDGGISIIQSDQPYKLLSYIWERETGSGVSWDVTFSNSPVYLKAKAIVRFTFDRAGTLYYTTDGSDPTAESEQITRTLSLSDSCHVKLLFVPADGSEECRFGFNVMLGSDEFYSVLKTPIVE